MMMEMTIVMVGPVDLSMHAASCVHVDDDGRGRCWSHMMHCLTAAWSRTKKSAYFLWELGIE